MTIKPMLAHKYNPDKADYPAYIQPKLDGVRCIIQCEYDNVVSANVIRAYSRTGKEFMNVKHIKESLRNVFLENPSIVLDGELYNHGLKQDFEKIISLVRKTKPTEEHRQEASELIQYHVYDIANFAHATYTNRLSMLSSMVKYNHVVLPVETKVVLDYDEALSYHKYCLKQGYEGSIYLSLIHI